MPGEEPSLESLVHRYSDDETLRTMTQRLITPAIVGETGSSAWGLNLGDSADPDSGLAAGAGRIGSFAVGTTDNSLAKLTVSGTADQIQQIIRAYSTQTANLAEWQNSAGTVLASIDPSGNPTISNTAPQLILKDTTTDAKYLLVKVGGDKAYLQEIGGTDGSLVTLDLANDRTGFGTDSPGSRVAIKGVGTTSDTSSFNITDSDGNSILYVRDDGKIGIKNSSPNDTLDIDGYIITKGIRDTDKDTQIQVEESVDEDKIRMDTGGVERFILDEKGRTLPTQPAFYVWPTIIQSNIPINTNVPIVFGYEYFDVGNNFAANTFTAPVSGRYHFDVHISTFHMDIDANSYIINLKTPEREYVYRFDPLSLDADPTNFSFSFSVLAQMNANSTAYVYIHQTGGAQQTDIYTESWFAGYLVG